MNKAMFPIIALTIAAFGCKDSTPDLKAEEANLRQTDSAWAATATNGADINKVVSFWADDAIVLGPGQPPVKGRDALKKMVEDSKKIPGFSITWKSGDIHFSPDAKLAYMSGENLMTMNDSTGKKISMPGRGYTIWRKDADGNWKCVVDTWNEGPPAQ